MGIDRHKEKLIKVVSEEITVLFEKILNYAELSVANREQYKVLRSRILRLGNNSIRNLSREINSRYDIKYNPPAETIIEIKNDREAKA